MNFKSFEQLKKIVILAPARKEVLKTRLFAHIRGASALASRPAVAHNAASWFRRVFSLPVVASFVAVSLVGAGTAAAAEKSRPDDVLYPVKVNVNEPIAALLSFGAHARAATEARFAERRLIEASELAAEGKLSEKVNTELAARFEARAKNAQANIADLTNEGNLVAAAETASHFESALRAHQTILARIAAGNTAVAAATAPLQEKIETEAVAAAHVRASLDENLKARDGSATTEVAAEGRITAAENALASSARFIEAKRSQLGEEATRDAEEKLTSAQVALDGATADRSEGFFGEAFVGAGDALRIAQEARLLVKARRTQPAAPSTSAPAESLRSSDRRGSEQENEHGERDQISAGVSASASMKVELKEDDIESNVDSLLKAGL